MRMSSIIYFIRGIEKKGIILYLITPISVNRKNEMDGN